MSSTKQQKQQQHRERNSRKRDLLDRIMGDRALSSSAARVGWALLHKFHNTGNDRCNPGFPAMAKVTGLSTRTVFSAIAELKTAGWISVESIGGGSKASTNRYKFDWERQHANIDPNFEASTSESAANIDEPETRHAKSAPLNEEVGMQDSSPGMQTSASEPLRTTPSYGRGGERDSNAQRAPSPSAAARSRSKEDLATKFNQLCQVWQNPNGTHMAKSCAAFLVACDGGAEPDAIIAMAEKHVALMAAAELRFFKQLDKWLTTGQWQFDPVDRNSKRGGKKASGAPSAAKKTGSSSNTRDQEDRRYLYLKLASEQEEQVLAFERYVEKFNMSEASDSEIFEAWDVDKKFDKEVFAPVEKLADYEREDDPVRDYANKLYELSVKLNNKLSSTVRGMELIAIIDAKEAADTMATA